MPLKNSLGVERRIDLASLFCMIGRHGPAVALAVIAMVSVLAGIVIYRNMRGKRRKAEVDASEGRSRGETRDESVMQWEREGRPTPLTDESDEDPSDVPRINQSDFTTRKRHTEKNRSSYGPPGSDVIAPAAKKVQADDTRSFFRDVQGLQRDDRKVPEEEVEEAADGWTARRTSGTRDDECGTKESEHVVDERCSETKIQKEEAVTRGSDLKDKRLDQTTEDIKKQNVAEQTSEFPREELVVSSKDEDESNGLDGYEKYDASVDAEEPKSGHVDTEEKPVSACHVNAVEQDESRVEGKVEEVKEQLVKDVQDENCDLQRGSEGAEDEPVNGLATVSDEEQDAHVTLPSCDLKPDPAEDTTNHDVHVVPPGSIVDATESKVIKEDENNVEKTIAEESQKTMIEETNGEIPAIDLHEEAEESPKDFVCRSLDPANVPVQDARSENSNSQRASDSSVNEPKSEDDSTAMFEEQPGVDDLKSDKTSDSASLPTSLCPGQQNTDLKTPEKKAGEVAVGDCDVSATSGMFDESSGGLDVPPINNDEHVSQISSTGVERSSAVLDKEPDVNVPSCEGGLEPTKDTSNQSVDPELINCDADSPADEEASASCEEQDEDMDLETSDETCGDVATPEEPPKNQITNEDLGDLVTAQLSAMTVSFTTVTPDISLSFANNDGHVPNIAAILETQATEIDHTEVGAMDCEPQTQTTPYADDVTVYVAKIENTVESCAVNEDTLGQQIEDSYYELMENLMLQITGTIATLTHESTDTSAVAEPDEKKKEAGKEKHDDDEVHEKTEISIMEATMDHNEWITDGNYQTLPWMNLPIQTKTDQRSLTDVEMASSSDVTQTSNQGLVDEIADNGKKVVAVQPMPQNVNVTVSVHYVTHSPHHTVAITGNQQELGTWKEFIPLEKGKDELWTIVLSLPAESHVEWKFVVVEEGEVCRWEECANRLLDTGCGDDILVHKCWGIL